MGSQKRVWTLTTSKVRLNRLSTETAPSSRSPTRSASAVTTPSSSSAPTKELIPPMATAVKAPPAAPADTPLGQLQMLCDPGTSRRLRSGVSSRRVGGRAPPGDGAAAGAGEVDGRPVFCYAQDPAFLGGSLGEVHADTIVRTMRMGGGGGAPGGGVGRS